MLEKIGPTLVCTARHRASRTLRPRLIDAVAHRSPELRAGADDPAELAAAARRQPHRLPLPRARVSDGRSLECRSWMHENPVHHRRRRGDVLRRAACATTRWRSSCWRAATRSRCCRSTRRPPPTNQRQPRIGCCLAASASTCSSTPRALPPHAAVSRSAVGLAAGDQRVRRAASLSTDPKLLGDLTISMLEGDRRRPAQGVRQAARVAGRRAAARRRSTCRTRC